MPSTPNGLRLTLGAIALSAISTACASSGYRAPNPFPMPAPPVSRAPSADPGDVHGVESPGSGASFAAEQIVETAMNLRGSPYRNGGSDPRGFDCSGFTQYVFARAGTALPRETRAQFGVGTPVEAGEQQPGDLIFFTTTAPGASHVGIAIGGDAFVHAPSSRGVVRVESLSLPYWSRRMVGIRRIGPN